MLRAVLRQLPCRPPQRPYFRSEVIATARDLPATSTLGEEALFLLRAQQHLHELNMRYFPQSGMTEKEVVAATAARVGFRMPKSDPPSSSAPPAK